MLRRQLKTKRRVYQTRSVGGKIMLRADFERLHKYMGESHTLTSSRMKCAR
jgi:hypothetical protein